MKRHLLTLLAVFAFLVQLIDGRQFYFPTAVGFVLSTKEISGEKAGDPKRVVPSLLFKDREGRDVINIPLEYLAGALALPEHRVM